MRRVGARQTPPSSTASDPRSSDSGRCVYQGPKCKDEVMDRIEKCAGKQILSTRLLTSLDERRPPAAGGKNKPSVSRQIRQDKTRKVIPTGQFRFQEISPLNQVRALCKSNNTKML